MATEVFAGDVYGTATRHGKDIYAATSEDIKPGMLCMLTSGSSVTKASASDAPEGVAYGARHQAYRPDSKTFDDGEEMVLLMGDVWCLYSSDFFVGGTLPTADNTLYSAAGGLMDTSGTYKVGRCIKVGTRIEQVAGVGTSQSLALVQLELKP